jgi:hypothetical protein
MNALAIQLSAIFALACVFVFGKYLRISSPVYSQYWLSAAAGASVAYVFVRALPEMSEAQEVFTRVTFNRGLPFPELHVYTAALIGFLFFDGLEHLASRSSAADRVRGDDASPFAYKLQLGGFAVYGVLVGYLIVHQRSLPTLLYLIAMALHFLAVDHSLEREYGSPYERSGRWLLAAAILAGGLGGILTSMPEELLATLLGLNCGGVIMNSMITELGNEKKGHFWPFCLGAIAYSLLLLLI